MGMFDWYWPAQDLSCPVDGHPLRIWQSTECPCLLFDWKEGEQYPVGQHIPEDDGTPREYWHEFTLPETFSIYSWDCPLHHPVQARGSTQDGIWRSTVVLNNGIWNEWAAGIARTHPRIQARIKEAQDRKRDGG